MVARVSSKKQDSSESSSEDEAVPVTKKQMTKKTEKLEAKPAESANDSDDGDLKIHKKVVNNGLGEGTQTALEKRMHKRLADQAAAKVNSEEMAIEGAFDKFNLPKNLTTKLEAKGIKYLYPIQIASLEPIREGHDIIAQARTGTGKTVSIVSNAFDQFQSFE